MEEHSPRDNSRYKGTGVLTESAVLEEMEAWLEWRVNEGEPREKAVLTVYFPLAPVLVQTP